MSSLRTREIFLFIVSKRYLGCPTYGARLQGTFLGLARRTNQRAYIVSCVRAEYLLVRQGGAKMKSGSGV